MAHALRNLVAGILVSDSGNMPSRLLLSKCNRRFFSTLARDMRRSERPIPWSDHWLRLSILPPVAAVFSRHFRESHSMDRHRRVECAGWGGPACGGDGQNGRRVPWQKPRTLGKLGLLGFPYLLRTFVYPDAAKHRVYDRLILLLSPAPAPAPDSPSHPRRNNPTCTTLRN